MKKVLATLAATVLLGATCAGFVACGGNGGNSSAAWNIVGQEVTEEVWNAAFDAMRDDEQFEQTYSNFRLDFVTEGKYSVSGAGLKDNQNINMTITLIHAEKKTNAKMMDEFDSENDFEYYVDESVANPWGWTGYIKENDGSWQIDDNLNSAQEQLEDIFWGAASYCYVPSLEFEDYEYSSKYKGYILKNVLNYPLPDEAFNDDGLDLDDGATYGDLYEDYLSVLKFQNGKLVAVYAELKLEYSEEGIKTSASETMSLVFTYGGQSVTLPTIDELTD